MSDMKTIGANEVRVADHLPNLGDPKLNWEQNSSVLRKVMSEGKPIRDASPFNAIDSQLGIRGTENANTFLHMERNLLCEQGWRYNNGYWLKP